MQKDRSREQLSTSTKEAKINLIEEGKSKEGENRHPQIPDVSELLKLLKFIKSRKPTVFFKRMHLSIFSKCWHINKKMKETGNIADKIERDYFFTSLNKALLCWYNDNSRLGLQDTCPYHLIQSGLNQFKMYANKTNSNNLSNGAAGRPSLPFTGRRSKMWGRVFAKWIGKLYTVLELESEGPVVALLLRPLPDPYGRKPRRSYSHSEIKDLITILRDRNAPIITEVVSFTAQASDSCLYEEFEKVLKSLKISL